MSRSESTSMDLRRLSVLSVESEVVMYIVSTPLIHFPQANDM